ncbi:MAG: hypothetical protein WCA20_29295, partial [Candidatus Sulfotelmatobacter sp.]
KARTKPSAYIPRPEGRGFTPTSVMKIWVGRDIGDVAGRLGVRKADSAAAAPLPNDEVMKVL